MEDANGASVEASGVGGLTLVCPLRGVLKATAKRGDLLGPSEEKLRIDVIRHLLALGYPKEHIDTEAIVYRLGNSGRNSLRTDVVVYDIGKDEARALPLDERLLHALVLCEVKRDHAKADSAKETQVKPLLGPARPGALALYWDDIEQRVFWHDAQKRVNEAPLAALPRFGAAFRGAPELTFDDLKSPGSLLDLFARIEDVLHGEAVDVEARYTAMLQLLLAKLFDETQHSESPEEKLDLQDPVALGYSAEAAERMFNRVLSSAVKYFGAKLPKKVPERSEIPAEALKHSLSLIADRNLSQASPRIVQDFYMKFAKDLYRWDMAQYFTPTTLSDFIVEIVAPRLTESVKDPAAGSSDFLMATHRRRKGKKALVSTLFGSDNNATAVQVSELNKVLHGATDVEIKHEDSLANVDSGDNLAQNDVIICNPPFGTSITEKNPSVLAKFDLAHEWKTDGTGILRKQEKLRKTQQKGILFLEACVKMVRARGRIAIILPNGYLANRSSQYHLLREWLLRHCKIAGIIAFPRFTFKQSGADVSASVVLLEKREVPLSSAREDAGYVFSVEMVERVGWELGNKVGRPTWRRDPSDGSEIVEDGEKILDEDLTRILSRLKASETSEFFPWLAHEAAETGESGWTVPISRVLDDSMLTLDPKRHSEKFLSAQATVKERDYFRLGDVLDIRPEVPVSKQQRSAAEIYRYVEISDVGVGTYSWSEVRGWELPDRAKQMCEPGDVFVGSIWSSVRKWFMAGGDCSRVVVTNGFHRLRFKAGMESYRLDLAAGLCLETYCVQMRSLARGSDGLAEIHENDLLDVVLPRVTDPEIRQRLEPFVEQLRAGHTSLHSAIEDLVRREKLGFSDIAKRHSHVVLV
ncbi:MULTISPECIES: class I SAM-dependent DNA methyltransferase [Streptomyces]|uniref:HsdM family class I SAM-dependent methyltransferase n=1 Tax=Streptomyces TaxID=1883 RepID=UPI00167C01C0|nr:MULTISPECIES: N-6 DNA methylase [Streptomyces]MBD3576149.1 N-6 DNA methylase [Streptomyces sp. KD18]